MYNKLGLTLMLIMVVLFTGCANQQNGQQLSLEVVNDDGTINWEARKQLNEAAGEIVYMTGYYYAASPPDIQVVLASELGYFSELGLNVKVLPGLDAEGMKFLASDKAQIASAGSPSIVIQAVENGANIKGIATFGHVGTSALMVMEDSNIYKPDDLLGKTIGYHGALPANIVAMFEVNQIDASKVAGVSVGYDPTILANGQVDALTIYKSNEPYLMEQLGHKVRVIDPGEFGAETSFGVIAVNEAFARQHPTAVEDFLRATAKAHEYAVANPEQSVKMLADLSETVYDEKAELNRWNVERELVAQSQLDEHGVGYQTEEQWLREIDMLRTAKVVTKALTATDVMDNRYIAQIYNEKQLIWP